jgi:hypothetical protein
MAHLRTAVTFIACSLLVAAAVDVPRGAVTELGIRGRSNAHASIATNARFVAIAWGAAAAGGGTDVYVATSRDGGASFGREARVNDQTSQANLAGEQPPRVSLVQGPGDRLDVVVVWTAKSASGTRLLSARSNDSGQSFARPVALPGSEGSGNRGWHATASTHDGRVVAIWLDHREQAPKPGGAAAGDHAHHNNHGDGVARAQLSKLFFAPLDASAALPITGGVCYCCKTAIATAADGSIYATWRHVYPGNVRDIAFSVSNDGGRTFAPPIRVSDDRWVLDGCPENGPAIAVDGRRRVHIAWPTLVAGRTPGGEPTLALFHAISVDGRHFSPRQEIPTEGVPRHPQIAIGKNGHILVVWDEQGGGRRVALGRGVETGTGAIRFSRRVLSDGAPGSYPAVAATADGAVAAWTSGPAERSTLRVHRLDDRGRR